MHLLGNVCLMPPLHMHIWVLEHKPIKLWILKLYDWEPLLEENQASSLVQFMITSKSRSRVWPCHYRIPQCWSVYSYGITISCEMGPLTIIDSLPAQPLLVCNLLERTSLRDEHEQWRFAATKISRYNILLYACTSDIAQVVPKPASCGVHPLFVCTWYLYSTSVWHCCIKN